MSEPDFKKGDKVWLEATVLDGNQAGPKTVLVEIDYTGAYGGRKSQQWFPIDIIKNHIPAPKPIEVGCRVSYSRNNVWNGRVIFLEGNYAWVKWDENNNNCGGIYRLSSLNRRIE